MPDLTDFWVNHPKAWTTHPLAHRYGLVLIAAAIGAVAIIAAIQHLWRRVRGRQQP
jgi:hypothetical protein